MIPQSNQPFRTKMVEQCSASLANLTRINALVAKGASDEEIQSLMLKLPWEIALQEWHTINPLMLNLKDKIRKICRKNTDAPILITGPSGTGKELLAKVFEIPNEPFIAVNCGALPKDLIGSMFFGHRKGAFTGAYENRDGLLVEAGDGVIFLDEIGDFPLELQATLLRAMQEKVVMAIGDSASKAINCRFVAATKYDLRQRMQEGHFREDLFARLFTFEIRITPLSERPEDIAYIADKAFNWPHEITNQSALNDISLFNVRAIQAYVLRMTTFGDY